MFYNMLTLDGGNYNVSWIFNATSDTLEFLVEVRAVGWVGFGIAEAPATGMVGYDVAIGGVMSNGTSYFEVSWSQNVNREIFSRSFTEFLYSWNPHLHCFLFTKLVHLNDFYQLLKGHEKVYKK